jgi:hypothetical protein
LIDSSIDLYRHLTNGVDLIERNIGRLLYRIQVPVTVANLYESMLLGPSTGTLGFLTSTGVTFVDLSSISIGSNDVRLWLSVIAYNLGNLWRRVVLPKGIEKWFLTSLQQRPVKTGGPLVKHARYYWRLLAESHLTRRLFASMLRGFWLCRCQPGKLGTKAKPTWTKEGS